MRICTPKPKSLYFLVSNLEELRILVFPQGRGWVAGKKKKKEKEKEK
ncbi:MAG: hypothetical protein ACJAY7_000984 [Pseudohongiellaceae bacterium]|jgi:hypothetical protein